MDSIDAIIGAVPEFGGVSPSVRQSTQLRHRKCQETKAEAEYRTAMGRLIAAPQNTPEIKGELALAETQWLFLKEAINRLNSNRTSKTELEQVSKSCDNILEVMERVTKMYEGMKAG
jgi:hypothetical protein